MAKINLMPTGNKHVMMDEHGTEYYQHTEGVQKGKWAPGTYDGRKFVWTSTRKYYARKRLFEMADGSTKWVVLTKYTYERKLRPTDSPVGKNGRQYAHAYLETFADLYWDGETLYRAANVPVEFDEDGKPTRYINSIVPFTEWDRIWDRYPDVTRDIVFDAA